MATLLAIIAVLFFSSVAVMTGLEAATFLALVSGTIYFGALLVRQLSQLPRLNLPVFIAIGSGLFYFIGGAMAVGAHLVIGENPYIHFFAQWKNYDPAPMAAAMCLAFACSLLTIHLAGRISFRNLAGLTSSAGHYGGDPARALPDRMAGLAISLATGALAATLLITGILRPQGASDLMVTARAEGNEWVVLFSSLAPAIYLLLAYQLSSRDLRFSTKLLVSAAAIPILFGTLMLGRRYVIAAAVLGGIGLVTYRGVRMRPAQWLAAAGAAILGFFVISAPFIAFRQAVLGKQSVDMSQMLSGVLSGDRVAGVQKMSMADVAAFSGARADIMSELAQLTSRIPAGSFRLGTGFASQLATLVPNFMWHDKPIFLATKMYNDFAICRDASLPMTDLAGTLVLYSFGEFGWLAPIWFAAVVLGFVWACDKLVRVAGSFTFKLMTVSTLVVYAMVADNQWGGTVLGMFRFLVVAGALIAATRIFAGRPRRSLVGRASAASRPS